MPTMLNSHVVPPPFGSQIGAVSGTRSPIFQPKRSASIAADDRPLPVVAPRLDLLGRDDELGIHLQEHVRLNRHVCEEVRRVLVDTAEPRLMRGELDALRLLQPRFVRHRQRHDEADFVDQHQPVGAGDLDSERERLADRHQDAEQHEGDEDRQQREDSAELPPPDVLPDEREKFHAWSLVKTPFSR